MGSVSQVDVGKGIGREGRKKTCPPPTRSPNNAVRLLLSAPKKVRCDIDNDNDAR